MDLQSAIAIVLAYDIIPVALLEPREKISLHHAKKVVKESAYRASSDFMLREASDVYKKEKANVG